jgi:hypothetical protein
MGVALYPTFEREISGADVDGKALARAQEQLDQIAAGLQVRPLGAFISVSDEMAQFAEDEGLDLEAMPPRQWFAASDGLKTVRALLGHGLQSVARADWVLADLRSLERVLASAEKHDVRFHLAVDF